MTTAQALAPHLRARRAKIFAGFERPRQLDRNLRARLMTRGRALKNARCAPRTATDFSIQGRPRSHNFYPSPKFRREPQTKILFLR